MTHQEAVMPPHFQTNKHMHRLMSQMRKSSDTEEKEITGNANYKNVIKANLSGAQ